ncbi:MAG: DUF5719 family protein, partial [Actinomycetota bacterium]
MYTSIGLEGVDTHNLVWAGPDLYAGCEQGHVYHYDGGTSWTDVGPAGSGNMRSMVWTGANLFVGSSDSHVYRYDGGTTWIDTGLVGGGDQIRALAWHGSNLYAGRHDGHVYRYDGGTTWTDVGQLGPGVNHVMALLSDGTNLYGGAYYYSIYRYDGGTTWTQVGDTGGHHIETLGWDGTSLYAGCGGDSSAWVYRDDGAMDWTYIGNLSHFGALDVEALQWTGTDLYAGCSNGHVYRYEGGTTWIDTGPIGCAFIADLAWDGTDLYAGGDGVYVGDPGLTLTITSITPNAGIIGSTVSVSNLAGTNFAATPIVKLKKQGQPDITASNVTFVSSGKLTFDIVLDEDTATGAWDVYVQNPDGYSVTKPGAFTVNEHPAPTISSITPGGGVRGTTVQISDLAGTGFYGTPGVELRKGSDGIGADAISVVSPTQITCSFNIPDAAPAGAWDILVTNPDGKTATLAGAFMVNEPPEGDSTWYLAEGTTAWGFSTYIDILNPNPSEQAVRVTYLFAGGGSLSAQLAVPALSQTTLTNDHLTEVLGGGADFSTKVECIDVSKTIAVDRTMYWTGGAGAGDPLNPTLSPEGNGGSQEAHSSVGVTEPASTWYFPEGSSKWGFECWLLIQNPTPHEATLHVTYMIDGEGPTVFVHTVGPNSRASVDMAGDIGDKDASIMVESSVPVICERTMYRNQRREGHNSTGATAPATTYYLAEGTTAWGFTTYVLVQNPNSAEAEVTLTYMTDEGPEQQAPFTMPANSRRTVRVNDALPDKDFSTKVEADRGVIAERAMYWESD